MAMNIINMKVWSVTYVVNVHLGQVVNMVALNLNLEDSQEDCACKDIQLI